MATPGEVQLALRLRELRTSAKLTQGELARVFSEDGRQVGAAAISSWENPTRPAALPDARLEPYARLHTLSGSPKRLVAVADLTADQREIRDRLVEELQRLLDQVAGGSSVAGASRVAYRSWFFGDDGPVVIVVPDAPEGDRGPLAEKTDPNYTAALRYTDVDALIELHGHIRAENDPALPVFFKPASEVRADDLSAHVVLVGGIAYNPVTRELLRRLSRLPIRQTEDPEVTTGEIFAVGHGKDQCRFLPVWTQRTGGATAELEQDVGLLARVRNPFNSSRTLTLCNGIHSRGVLGSVRALTDARIRESNEAYLAEHFPHGEFGLLVRVPVLQGEALSPDLQDPENILYSWPESAAATARRERA